VLENVIFGRVEVVTFAESHSELCCVETEGELSIGIGAGFRLYRFHCGAQQAVFYCSNAFYQNRHICKTVCFYIKNLTFDLPRNGLENCSFKKQNE